MMNFIGRKIVIRYDSGEEVKAHYKNATELTLVILITVVVTTVSWPPRVNSQTRTPAMRRGAAATATTLPDGVAAKDVHFYSEGIQCYGKIFTPKNLSAESKTPTIALAPDWGETATSIEKYAAHFASRGLVAMVIDYRGW